MHSDKLPVFGGSLFLEIQVLSYISIASMISLIFSYPTDYSFNVSMQKKKLQKYSNQS